MDVFHSCTTFWVKIAVAEVIIETRYFFLSFWLLAADCNDDFLLWDRYEFQFYCYQLQILGKYAMRWSLRVLCCYSRFPLKVSERNHRTSQKVNLMTNNWSKIVIFFRKCWIKIMLQIQFAGLSIENKTFYYKFNEHLVSVIYYLFYSTLR